MELLKILKEIRVLYAAYELANNCDHVPAIEDLGDYIEDYETKFTNDDYRLACLLYEGYSPSNVMEYFLYKIYILLS